MALSVVHNTPSELDYAAVAASIREAYARRDLKAPPHDFNWRYLKGFGRDSVILSVHDDDVRIGQAVVLIRQLPDGRRISLLGDLYVDEGGSAFAAMLLYRNLQALLEEGNFSLIYTVPNKTAADLDRKVLGLDRIKTVHALPAVALAIGSKGGQPGRLQGRVNTNSITRLDNQMLWQLEDLKNRLAAPCQDFVVGRGHDAVLVAVTRKAGAATALVLAAAYGEGRASDWREALNQCVGATGNRLVLNATHKPSIPGLALQSSGQRFGKTFEVSYRVGEDGEGLQDQLQFLDLDVM